MTIRNFTDHAANERTYLAWIRTALALLGIGFVIERFELFGRGVAGLEADSNVDPLRSAGDAAGLGLIVLGILVLVFSTNRYIRFRREIASEEIREFKGARTDLILVAVISAIALFMCLYVAHVVLA